MIIIIVRINDNNDKNDTNYNLNDNYDNENGINDNDAKRVQSCTFTLHAAQEILVAPLWPLKASRPQRHEPGSTSCHAVSMAQPVQPPMLKLETRPGCYANHNKHITEVAESV